MLGSFWLHDVKGAPASDSPPQGPPIFGDDVPMERRVVVIGGGMTGASAAYHLQKEGFHVCVLEGRDHVSAGATGRNGGHLWPGIEDLRAAIDKMGPEKAADLNDFTYRTTRGIREYVEGSAEASKRCDLRRTGGVVLASSEKEWEGILSQVAALKTLGLEHYATLWSRERCEQEMHSQGFVGGLCYDDVWQVWPARLVQCLMQDAQRMGATIITRCPVERVERLAPQIFQVHGVSGARVRCGHVVHATNAFASRLLPSLRSKIVPVRGHMIVTNPQSPLWPVSLLANDGFEYAQQRLDGRIALGGMRLTAPGKDVGVDDDTTVNEAVIKNLRQFLVDHFPPLQDVQIEYQWSGIMGFTQDHLPIVGELPSSPHEYIAAGYSGHGLPFTFGCGRAIAWMIAGRTDHGLPPVLAPSRILDGS
eukprot:TRINITY_DN7098_c0_g1_i2.p1 TRINITY_DN7098_c0_g1~~TRINITY_DN7098_c0_g1_i2.p1  ORF type:complete len:421 (+),score=101.30 TRINITY_DN7098_c0_g1_i2:80-1342(+)